MLPYTAIQRLLCTFFAIPWITNTLGATISAIQRIFTNLWSLEALATTNIYLWRNVVKALWEIDILFIVIAHIWEMAAKMRTLREMLLWGGFHFQHPQSVSIVSLLESKNKQTSCVRCRDGTHHFRFLESWKTNQRSNLKVPNFPTLSQTYNVKEGITEEVSKRKKLMFLLLWDKTLTCFWNLISK